MTLSIAFTIVLSTIFPGLIWTITSSYEKFVDPFEVGSLAMPVIYVSLFCLGLGMIFYSGYMPLSVKNGIQYVLNFETSRRISFITMFIMLSIYIVLSVEQLFEPDEWDDFWFRIIPSVESWPYHPEEPGTLNPYITFPFLVISEKIFQNVRIVPFIVSISLLILTYYFTKEISKKRFSGLISVAILIQSFTFLKYDSTPAYTNFWILFYLLSLYLIIKKWQFSFLFFLFSILSKPLSIVFFPSSLFFIYISGISKKQKLLATICLCAIIITLILATLLIYDPWSFGGKGYNLNFDKILKGLSSISYQLRFDQFFVVFLIPLTWALFMISKKGNRFSNSILLLIFITLLSAPLTYLVDITIQPYRLIPFIVFFSIGSGIIFSQKNFKI